METTTMDARHPVRVVSQRTGLTPATLRAWERRYAVVTPGRSDGGQRLYSDEDVERLTILHQLTEGGRSISMVAGLSLEDARALLEEDREAAPAPAVSPSPSDAHALFNEALARTRALDGEGLQAQLRRAAVTLGVNAFLDELVAPLLHELGDGWIRGDITPAQEHMASEVVEGVLAWLAQPVGSGSRPILVVGTLPGELHRLGARLVAAAAVFEGWQVSYLGADLPGSEIAEVAHTLGARAVAVSVVSPAARREVVDAIRELESSLGGDTPILLGGQGASSVAAEVELRHARVVEGLEGLRESLRRLG